MGLSDILKSLEFQICVYSVFIAVVSFYFVASLFAFLKVDVPYSVLAFLFYLLITVAGFVTAFIRNDRFKTYSAYFLLAQVVISITLVVVAATTIKSDTVAFEKQLKQKIKEEDRDYLNGLHNSLSCCSFYKPSDPNLPKTVSQSLLKKVRSLAEKDDIRHIASCCWKLEGGECGVDRYWKINCVDAYEVHVSNYKTWTIVLVVFSIVFQVLLFYSFYKHAGY